MVIGSSAGAAPSRCIQRRLGIKGLGELGNVGTNAAVANAVYHATGVQIRDLPIRLEKLLDAPTITLRPIPTVASTAKRSARQARPCRPYSQRTAASGARTCNLLHGASDES
jgi:hypothetical protein